MSQPQNESASSSITESSQKQIEDMKKFMAKDAIELASGLKEKPFAYDVLPIRGRSMVIPKAPAARMIPATTMACFYALRDPRIDEIFERVGAHAHFMTATGEIEIQPIIKDSTEVGEPKEVSINPKVQEPVRHIFLDEDPPKPFEQKGGQMVAILNPGTDLYDCVGVIWAWNTKPPPIICHIVRTMDGKQLEVQETFLKKIDSMEEFATLCSEAHQQ